jgi:hypothetical protein
LPQNALLGLFIAVIIVVFVCIALLLRAHSSARGGVRKVLHYAILTVAVFFIQVLVLYIEGGWGVGFSIMIIFMWAASILWGSKFADLIALPIFSIHPEIQLKVKKFLRFAYLSFLVVNFSTLTALAVTRSDPIAFNKAMLAYQFALFASCACHASIISYYGSLLQARVDKIGLETRDTVRIKVQGMKKAAIQVVFGQSFGLLANIIFFVLGSVPFLWTVMFLSMLSAPISFTKPTLDLLKKYPSSSSNKDGGATSRANDTSRELKRTSSRNDSKITVISDTFEATSSKNSKNSKLIPTTSIPNHHA